MATLTEQYEIIDDGRKLGVMANRFQSAKNELDAIFNNLESMRDKYQAGSDERTEVETKINQGKTLLQNMLNTH